MSAWEGSEWQRQNERQRERDEREAERRGITLWELRRRRKAQGTGVRADQVAQLRDLMARLYADGHDSDAALIRDVLKGKSPRED